jgi:hypothetical protein
MSHPLEFLLRGVRKAEFAEGLQMGCQEVEKELADLWECEVAGGEASQGGQLAHYAGKKGQ